MVLKITTDRQYSDVLIISGKHRLRLRKSGVCCEICIGVTFTPFGCSNTPSPLPPVGITSTDRRISIPNVAAYLFLDTFIWLVIFLVMVIYAAIKNNSGGLPSLIVLFFIFWITSMIGVIYFSKKYKW